MSIPLKLLFEVLNYCRGRLFFTYYYDEYVYSIETHFVVNGRYALAFLRLLPLWSELKVKEIRLGEGCSASLARGENEAVEIVLL